jgi:hypothetical protein
LRCKLLTHRPPLHAPACVACALFGILAAYAIRTYVQCRRGAQRGAPWRGPMLVAAGILVSLLRRMYVGVWDGIPVTKAMPALIIEALLLVLGLALIVRECGAGGEVGAINQDRRQGANPA